MGFSRESLEQLRERVSLVELLANYLDLQRSGNLYKALCPFHQEKTASFIVRDNYYHCFGCSARGDAIQFLMDFAQLSFLEAVDELSRRFGVPLVMEAHADKQFQEKKSLQSILEAASLFYHELLMHRQTGERALDYLLQRGISLEAIRRFRLGWAPRGGLASLQAFLEKQGFDGSLQALAKAGIVHTYSLQELWEDRILIPLNDSRGRVVGFSARAFVEGVQPKYINSPETLLFKKSKMLFGIDHSRQAIARTGRAILVEGQIDAMQWLMAGFDSTVATQGTAVGEFQVQELARYAVKEVVLVFDSDLAGQEAAVKAGHLFLKKGIDVRVLRLPVGEDPDLFLRTRGERAVEEALAQVIGYIPFLVEFYSKKLGVDQLTSPVAKMHLVEEIQRFIKQWDSALLRHSSEQLLAQLLNIPPHWLSSEKKRAPSRTIGAPSLANHARSVHEQRIVAYFLKVAPHYTEVRQLILSHPVILQDPYCAQIYAALHTLSDPEKVDHFSLATMLSTSCLDRLSLIGRVIVEFKDLPKAILDLKESIHYLLLAAWKEEGQRLVEQSTHLSGEPLADLLKRYAEHQKSAPYL